MNRYIVFILLFVTVFYGGGKFLVNRLLCVPEANLQVGADGSMEIVNNVIDACMAEL